MPYNSIRRLPNRVHDNLPQHAQEIYKEAYNSAYEHYSDADNREERAHKVAWSAVKEEYEQDDEGNWHRK
jgi:cation transport regulator